MTNDASEGAVLAMLHSLAEDNGLTQAEVASRLGVSQGHLSKILRGIHKPGRRLTAAISRLAPSPAPTEDAWVARVSTAAAKSEDFRAAVNAILRIMR